MQRKHVIAAALATTVLVGSGAVLSAEEPMTSQLPTPDMERMPRGMMGGDMMGRGMMGGGMMGMMEMMERCSRMRGGGAMGAGMMPQLPPGNEKLELQLHAEIMQRVGEILSKYAAKVQEGTR